LIITCN